MGWVEALVFFIYVGWLVCLYLDYRYDHWVSSTLRKLFGIKVERLKEAAATEARWAEEDWREKYPLPSEYRQTYGEGRPTSKEKSDSELIERH